jgi:hypothetical protein
MERDVADALRRGSLCDLVLLAHEQAYKIRDCVGGVPSRILVQISEAIQEVIRRRGYEVATPRRQSAFEGMVLATTCSPVEDLAYVLRMPDVPELAPAVEAAAQACLARGAMGRDVLFSRALLGSEVMRSRVAAIFEKHGDIEAALSLRRHRERGLLP